MSNNSVTLEKHRYRDNNMSVDEERVRTLLASLKKRGVVYPAFEIYGGVAGLFDYGPVGARILRLVKEKWLDHWLTLGNIVEIDSPTITPRVVLESSGHVGAFNDHAVQCKTCNAVCRADHLLEDVIPNPDSMSANELDIAISTNEIPCPSCSKPVWDKATPMNLMFSTNVGPVGEGRQAFLRPETAQGMFTNFSTIYRHFRQRLPFGAVQIGKGYRNEISPRQGMIRQREFNMAELEYFIDPDAPVDLSTIIQSNDNVQLIADPRDEMQSISLMTIATALEKGIIRHPIVGKFMLKTYELLTILGIDPQRIRFRQHEQDEMAHYASDCWDCEIHGSYGWIECVGIAHRGCYDLEAHSKSTSSTELKAWREFDNPVNIDEKRWVPIQASIGPSFRQDSGDVIQSLHELNDMPDSLPFELILSSGKTVTIDHGMVELRRIQKTIKGEWFTPHVIEPAFGIDRIVWHILDHSFDRTEKEGEIYDILRLKEQVAPYDAVVLPLFNKDGMPEMANQIYNQMCLTKGIIPTIDAFGKSIGRRYARADEIGIPWAITIDHQSTIDNTVTVRKRDNQQQIRMDIQDLISRLAIGNLADSNKWNN